MAVNIMTVITDSIKLASIIAAAGITLCPAWYKGPTGNLHGPLFSIVDGAWALSSIPTCVGYFSVIINCYATSEAAARTVVNTFLLGVFGSMLSAMMAAGVGNAPLFPIFGAGLLMLAIFMSGVYFPDEKKKKESCAKCFFDVDGDSAYAADAHAWEKATAGKKHDWLNINDDATFAPANDATTTAPAATPITFGFQPPKHPLAEEFSQREFAELINPQALVDEDDVNAADVDMPAPEAYLNGTWRRMEL